MTAPLPINVSGISDAMPDPAHEALRVHVLDAIQQVWGQHVGLVGTVTRQAEQLAALTNRVAVLAGDPISTGSVGIDGTGTPTA